MSTRLRWLALALALAAAAVLVGPIWADSGSFAVWGLGLPVLLCALPIVAASSRYSTVVTWAAAVGQLAWALVLALGVGVFLLPAAVVELAAAAWPRPERLRA